MAIAAPTDIANCVLWLDASQEAYADGAAVGTWADRSGSGNNATQGTAANRPTFRAGVRNGLAALEFDGTSSFMSLASSPFNMQAGTSFAVCQLNTLTQDGARPARYTLGFRDASDRRWYIQTDAVNDSFRTAIGTTGGVFAGTADFDWHVVWLRADGNAKSSWWSCVGGEQSFNDSTTGTSGLADGIGKIANGGTWQEGWSGYISEIIHYSRGLTTSEVRSVERYLGSRWAIDLCYLRRPTVGQVGFG